MGVKSPMRISAFSLTEPNFYFRFFFFKSMGKKMCIPFFNYFVLRVVNTYTACTRSLVGYVYNGTLHVHVHVCTCAVQYSAFYKLGYISSRSKVSIIKPLEADTMGARSPLGLRSVSARSPLGLRSICFFCSLDACSISVRSLHISHARCRVCGFALRTPSTTYHFCTLGGALF